MSKITRRQAIGSAALSASAIAMAGTSRSSTAQTPPADLAFAGSHTPKPLRFNPASLTGLSERLITSHWENNYQGSVRALNTIESRLAAAMADSDFPPVAYAGLKREELHRTGSVVLHEYYFDALGGNGSPGGSIHDALGLWFGSFEAWAAEFRRTAMSLAGGSGWCLLTYNRHTASLHNYWAWDHMHAAVNGAPLIALDMYEHSFHMDYGTAAARYIDAFMANLDWEVIDQRFTAARA
jgi:Fe-Mn family superoxide dismutase